MDMKVIIEKEVASLRQQITDAVKTAKNNGKSVQWIATTAGMSDAALYNIVGGKSDRISIDLLKNLETILEVEFQGIN
jgi:hypothetical protein